LAEQQERAARETQERTRLQEERERLAQEAQAARLRAEAAEAYEAPDRTGPVVTMGAGGAMVLVAGATALVSRVRVNDLQNDCPGDRCNGVDLAGRRAKAYRLARTTDVMLFGGVAVALTGAIWWMVQGSERPESQDEPPTTASFGCDGSGCAADVRVRF
jgi:hypothetical protein